MAIQINATCVSYFFSCHRKLWLFANGINMEHTSALVADGKLLHDTTYSNRPASASEIILSFELDGGITLSGRIDFFDEKERCVFETKRSDSMEEAHEWQVKFYLWLLALNGIDGAYAKITYPKVRQTHTVPLLPGDIPTLEQCVKKIATIVLMRDCPPKHTLPICQRCAYFDFCYVNESVDNEAN